MQLSLGEIKEFLDEKAELYNRHSFIVDDPIGIPHLFNKAEDIEIAGFLAASISWGNRKSIVASAKRLVGLMDNAPHDFILHYTESDFHTISKFVYRTFNSLDLQAFILSLKKIYLEHGGLRSVFEEAYVETGSIRDVLVQFRNTFCADDFLVRSHKHVSSVANNSSAKRLNMFLRWMVRSDARGVDFGLWNKIPPSALYLPLDLHTGNVARKLGILSRNANDWKSVEEVSGVLKSFSPEDPIKYDFALFGLGIYEHF